MTDSNILFIVADQHNAKVLGHKGHPDAQTPHLDRMAREGCRFDNAITQNPICTPSRVSFLSGQYPHNHGYYSLSGPNPGGLPNIFGHFRAAGYFTAAMGKIHCPEYWVEDQCDVFHESNSFTAGSVVGRSAAYTRFLRERGVEDLEDHILLPEFGARGRQSVDSRPEPAGIRRVAGRLAGKYGDRYDADGCGARQAISAACQFPASAPMHDALSRVLGSL